MLELKYHSVSVDVVLSPSFKLNETSNKNLCISVIGEEQTGKSTFIKNVTVFPFEVSEKVNNRASTVVFYGST